MYLEIVENKLIVHLVHRAYARPVLEYGTTAFSPKCRREIIRLESVKKVLQGKDMADH